MFHSNIRELTLLQGGGTFTREGLPYFPGSGYAVAVTLGTYAKLSTGADFGPTVDKLLEDFSGGSIFIGTWVQGDTVHLDPVMVLDSLSQALSLGQALKQESIYDFYTDKVIEVPS